MNWITFLQEKIYRIYILFLNICEENTDTEVSSFMLPVTRPIFELRINKTNSSLFLY